MQMRGEFEHHPLGHLGLQHPAAVLETLERRLLLRRGAQHTDKNTGIAQVGRDIDGIDRDESAVGRHLAQDDRAQFAFENFSNPDQTVFHASS
jgi:hypothetical protein